MHHSFPFLAAALVVPAIPAQSHVHSPAHLAHHQGEAYSYAPFGGTKRRSASYQQIHGDMPSRIFPIARLAIRPGDKTGPHAAFTVTLSLSMGQNGPTPLNASWVFATNLGPNPTVILSRATVNMPALKTVPRPAPFTYVFPFPKPYFYQGRGVLCWEMRVHNHTLPTGRIWFDGHRDHQGKHQLLHGGAGCKASGAAGPATLDSSPPGQPFFTPAGFTLAGTNLPPGGSALLLAGLSSTGFGPFTLPLDLTPLGAPCALRTSTELMLPAPVSTGGVATWKLSAPPTPGGTVLYFQALAADAQANPLGLVLTDSLAAVWAFPASRRPVVRVVYMGNDKRTSGILDTVFGAVVRFSAK